MMGEEHERDERHGSHGAEDRAAERGDYVGHEAHAEHGSGEEHAAHGEHAPNGGGHDHSDHHDHGKHAGHSVEMFRDRFWFSLLLTIPTLIWSELLQDLIGYTAPEFTGSGYIPAVFGTAVFVYGGRVFLQGARRELGDRLPGMMTLISLAITVAFVFSVAVALGFQGMPLWWELATLVTIMLLGHWMEMRSVTQARGALQELAELIPSTATRLTDGDTEEIPVDQLREGDLLLVRPGESIPIDAEVEEGSSSVNEAMLTGESTPVDKNEGAEVIGGTVNGSGSLRVRVTRIGEDTTLSGMMRLVERAQESRSGTQDLADRAAFWLTIAAVGAGTLTVIAWLIAGATASYTIQRLVTVLVIACPHALGLAIPLVVAISTTMGARNGLLVRDRRGLESAREIDAVVFDKTGTLTLGEHRVVDMAMAAEMEEDEALRLAAAVEEDAEHPVARAIVASARERELEVPRAENFEYTPGQGVSATVEGRQLHAGGPNLLRERGIEAPQSIREAAERFGSAGRGAVYLLEDDHVLAVFAVADSIRPESKEAIERLHREGVEVVMLTGDSRQVAEAVAAELGIDTVFAEVMPHQKTEKIEELQRQGKRVAMVGDGVNDAPALLTADVGVAIGAGTSVAVEAGDVVLVRSDPRDMPRIIALSRATYRKMIQNLWWAAGYNIVAIPLAAGVLAGQGLILHPAVGAVLMSLSTIIVALNAQLLRRQEI